MCIMYGFYVNNAVLLQIEKINVFDNINHQKLYIIQYVTLCRRVIYVKYVRLEHNYRSYCIYRYIPIKIEV